MYQKRTKSSKKSAFRRGHNKATYRSGLEDSVAFTMQALMVPFTYEKLRISYLVPASFHYYTPDFILLDNGIIVETKGLFDSSDRSKHDLIKEQYPWLDIRFVFSNPYARISKESKTTYKAWCDKRGIKWADQRIPNDWYLEESKPYLPLLKQLIEEGKKLESGHYSGNAASSNS